MIPRAAPFHATENGEGVTLSTLLSHGRLVELTAERMVHLGYTRVCASHINRFTACEEIGGFIPDATAFSGSAFVIAEAESQDGLAASHTVQQWTSFHAQASRLGGFFVATVNKSDEPAAQALLKQVCGSATNVDVWTF
jgi:hypothetical protein